MRWVVPFVSFCAGSSFGILTMCCMIANRWNEKEKEVMANAGGSGKQDREPCNLLLTDHFNWKWSLGYSADPAALPAWEGELAAKLALRPEEGHTYVIYHESSGNAIAQKVSDAAYGPAACEAYGDALTGPLPEEAQRFTVKDAGDGKLYILTADGSYLTCVGSGVLSATEEPADGDRSLWELQPVSGGCYIVSAGPGNTPLALQYYAEHFNTYKLNYTGIYIFNEIM